jgi:hypothetical protein
MLIAIDPGTTESAYAILAENYAPLAVDKLPNEELCGLLGAYGPMDTIVIERLASYGMPVGREVLETCEWVGHFARIALANGARVEYLYRREVKLHLCDDSRAGDANIRRALISRFAKHDLRTGKGTCKRQDWFFGFKADIWQAYALGVTWMDMEARNAI